jgi:hypothetical protein
MLMVELRDLKKLVKKLERELAKEKKRNQQGREGGVAEKGNAA